VGKGGGGTDFEKGEWDPLYLRDPPPLPEVNPGGPLSVVRSGVVGRERGDGEMPELPTRRKEKGKGT